MSQEKGVNGWKRPAEGCGSSLLSGPAEGFAGRRGRMPPLSGKRVFALVRQYGKNMGGTAEFSRLRPCFKARDEAFFRPVISW